MKSQSLREMMFVLTGALFLSTSFASAETIVLKSGKTVEGKIIERTDKYIKLDFMGVPITYFFDEVESIDSKKSNEPSQVVTSSQESKNIEKTKYAQNSNSSFEASSQKQEEQNIKNMFYNFFRYECNFVYDEGSVNKGAGRIINTEIENARNLIDWNNFDVPGMGFQLMYKMAVNEEMKTIAQRNLLTAKFGAIKTSYKNAGLIQRIEDYKIQKIDINNTLNDAIVVYTNVNFQGKFELKIHKINGSWLIYRDSL